MSDCSHRGSCRRPTRSRTFSATPNPTTHRNAAATFIQAAPGRILLGQQRKSTAEIDHRPCRSTRVFRRSSKKAEAPARATGSATFPISSDLTPEEVLANRHETIDLILTEVLRQRREQDERLEYVRRVAALFLGISLPATALALTRLEGSLPLTRAIIAGLLLLGGLGATYGVLRPRDWQAGPSIEELINGPYRLGADAHDFRWVLVRSHQEVFAANETQVRRAQRSFVSALFLLTLSAVVLWSAFVGQGDPTSDGTPERCVAVCAGANGDV